jgi:hypothetical protein
MHAECGKCKKQAPYPSKGAIYKNAREVGWLAILANNGGTAHYCPECRKGIADASRILLERLGWPDNGQVYYLYWPHLMWEGCPESKPNWATRKDKPEP